MTTNNTENSAGVSDKFQWQRVMMVARYYWPRIGWQIKFYPLISLAVLGLVVLCHVAGIAELHSSVAGILMYFVTFGAITLGMRRDYPITTVMPAKGSEKCAFVLLFVFVVLPVLAILPCELGSWLLYGQSAFLSVAGMEEAEEMSALMDNMVPYTVAQTLMAMATCMWMVVSSKRLRVLKGILVPVILQFVIGIVVGIVVAMSAIANVQTGGPRVHSRSGFDPSAVVDSIQSFADWMVPILAVYVVFAVYKGCRAICRRTL